MNDAERQRLLNQEILRRLTAIEALLQTILMEVRTTVDAAELWPEEITDGLEKPHYHGLEKA